MRKSMKEAIGITVLDMIESGINFSFTQKDLRKKRHLSQTVFAQLLNVSSSSVRQWEQGERIPNLFVAR